MNANRAIFVEGLDKIFSRWTALGLAIENEWGGFNTLQKSLQLKMLITLSFDKKGSKVEQEDLEDLLLDFMNDELGVMLEDSSEIQISQQILILYREATSGKRDFVNSLTSIPINNNNTSISQTDNTLEEFSVTEEDEANDELIDNSENVR